MEQQNLEQLFQRYLDDGCTEEEIKTLLQHFGAGENKGLLKNRILQQLQSEQEDISREQWQPLLNSAYKKIQEKISTTNKTGEANVVPLYKRRWFSVATAAAVLIFISTTIFLLFNNKKEAAIAVKEKTITPDNDIAPGHDNAILTLDDGRTIVLDSAANGALAKQGNSKVLKLDGQIVYNKMANDHKGKPVYNTIATAKGNQYQLVLADGSKVWLNAASSIHFPAAFTGNERRVEITGEAYFEVAHNAAKPFIVKVNTPSGDGGEIEVLGTHFNVNAYADEPDMKTTLLEGSVKIKKASAIQMLSPGQQARLTPDGIALQKNVDLSQVMAWKEGFFQFDNTDTKTLMRQVARWYDVDVDFQGKIAEEGFSGKISRNVPLSKFLKVLELNDVHIKTEGRKITVMP